MERLCELRAMLKGWEVVFERENGRRPGKADVAAASEDTKRLYREYRELKQRSELTEQSPAAQQDSGCWGSHLNRQPKLPGMRQQPAAAASAQLYGMRLKANLGTAIQEEAPSAVKRSLDCRRKITAPRRRAASPSADGDDESAPGLPESAPGLPESAPGLPESAPGLPESAPGLPESAPGLPESAPGLPCALRRLAPVVLNAASKPRPQADRFRKLKEMVARRLGSLDPGWLRRCQGTEGCGVGRDGCQEGLRGCWEGGMGAVGPQMGALGQEEGMRPGGRAAGGEEGSKGPQMGASGWEEGTRPGVRGPGPKMGTLRPQMGTLGPEIGTAGQEEGTLGPEIGAPGHKEGTRPGVRGPGPNMGTPGWEEGTLGPEIGTLGPEIGAPGRKEGTRSGVRTAGQEEGSPGPQMGASGWEEGALGPEIGTPGRKEGTGPGVRGPGPQMGTLRPRMGTLGPENGTAGQEEGTRLGVRTAGQEEESPGPQMGVSGREEGTLGPEIGSPGHKEGTRSGVRGPGPQMGTPGQEEGTLRPQMGTLGPETGTLRPDKGMRPGVRAQRLEGEALGPKVGTAGHEEETQGPVMGRLGLEEGTWGREEGTGAGVRAGRLKWGTLESKLGKTEREEGPGMGTLECEEGTLRRDLGTPGGEEGTPGPEMGSRRPGRGTARREELGWEQGVLEVGTAGRKRVAARRKRGTSGHEEGTKGPGTGTAGRDDKAAGPEEEAAAPTAASRGRKRGTRCERRPSGCGEEAVGPEEEMPGDEKGTAGPKGDAGRRRGRVPKDGAAAKPRAARRKRPGPGDGGEEPAAAPKRRRRAPPPSENLLGDFEEEKPGAVGKALPARAPRRPQGNFVRLNLKSRSHVRGAALRGRQLRKQVWKEKWQKKAARFGGGGAVDRSSDVCFKCGAAGHWAAQCRGPGTAAHAAPPAEPIRPSAEEEDEDEDPLPTLEEVARRTNTIYQQLPASSSDRDGAELTEPTPYLDVQRPPYEPPTPPAPVEPLYSLGPDGKPRETPREVLDALSELGYSSFRPGQEVAIMRILSGLSTLVVLPTGMGKSLCYQLPAFLYHKRSRSIALVVSPLVSLMDDQVSGLPPCLRAVCVHSHLSRAQRDAALRRVQEGSAQVLLLSPEALVGAGSSGSCCLPPAHQLPPVAFACIDEAHCVSEWSHNFRPSYLRLCKVLRDRLGVRCFLALTATATVATARDVAAQLGIPQQDGIAVRSAAVPHNLRLSVSVERDRDRALVDLLRSERYAALQSIIVYCTRREDTARVAALLRTCLQDELLTSATPGPRGGRRLAADAIAAAYHAGLSAAERRRVQWAFMSGRLRVVVATVAFGMGLDKADVRAVLHYNMPRNFESYVQEIGRAGRDGEPAWCHLFLDPEGSDRLELRRHIFADAVDFFTIKKLVQAAFPPCKCRELHRRRCALSGGAEVSDQEMAAIMVEEDGGTAEGGEQQRLCYKHERAIDVQGIVGEMDLREEAIETLLCYLELHPQRWLELLPHTYGVCTVRCYGGPRELRAAAQSCPPLAVALALRRLNSAAPPPDSCSLRFDVVALSDAMGWELPLVKRALRQLHSERRRGTAAPSPHGAVSVQFSELCFHLRSFGDLSHAELDAVCHFLQRRLEERQQGALRQLRACRAAFRSVAFQSCCPQPDQEEEEERSGRLKAVLQGYFEQESRGLGDGDEEEEEDEDEGLSAADDLRLRSDLRRFLSIHAQDHFSPRAIARIFHGIGSPLYPAHIYGRDRRFWRQHLHVGFHRLCRTAAEEILALR